MLALVDGSNISMCVGNVNGPKITQNSNCVTSCGRCQSESDRTGRCFREADVACRSPVANSFYFPIAKKGGSFFKLNIFYLTDFRLIVHSPLPQPTELLINELRILGLTDREIIIVGYLKEGYARGSLALILDIKKTTLKTHIKNIHNKIPIALRKKLEFGDP